MADPKDATAKDADFTDDPSLQQDEYVEDPELEGLTLYEKKAHLVNRELDSHGMGRYQWYIFFLCGFGYLIDLLYAQVRRPLRSGWTGRPPPRIYLTDIAVTGVWAGRAGDEAGVWFQPYVNDL